MRRGPNILIEIKSIHPSILVRETIEKFGYDPRLLRPSSCKLVVKKFECCGLITERKFRLAMSQHTCQKCSNKINAKKEAGRQQRSEFMKLRNLDPTYKHPTKGIGHSEQAKQKIHDNHVTHIFTVEERSSISRKVSGEGNPFYGKKHTLESLRKMSAFQSTHTRRGADCNFYGKSYHGRGAWVDCSLGRIWVRSSYEVAMVKFLDDEGHSWAYEPQSFPVTYTFKNKLLQGTYTPDFYLKDIKKYIEVKGYWRDDAKDKFQAFCEQYPNLIIEVWNEQVLRQKGVL